MNTALIDSIQIDINALYEHDEVKSVCVPYATLGKELVYNLPSLDGEILVLSDLGLLMAVLFRLQAEGKDFERVTFVAHSPEQEVFSQSLAVNTWRVDYNDPIAQLQKHLMGLKFDIIAGNPPYKAGMHLQFLELSFDVLKEDGELLFVHPAEWLVQKRDTSKSRKYAALKQKLEGNVRSITFIDNPWGDQGVVLQVPLVVTHLAAQHAFSFNDFRTTTKTHGAGAVPFKNKKSSTDETSVGNFTHWGDTPVIKSLLDKTQTQQRIGHLVQQKRGPFYINLSRITGDGWNIATYYDGVERKITNVLSVVGRIWEKVTTEPGFAKGGTGNEMLWISFETELEAQNFLAYVTKNKLIKALCAIYKIDQNVEGVLDVLPMLDQNVEWTDAKTYEYFDFSAAEILAIEQIVEMIDVNSYK